jgi:hypothetical protein
LATMIPRPYTTRLLSVRISQRDSLQQ